MLYSRLPGLTRRNEKRLVCLLLLLGILARALFLTQCPYGLNQDEASAGYEAWALLHYGIDRCGNSWPVLLVSWGSGQNILYSLLSMPFVALLGLNVFSIRLVSVLAGTAAMTVFWLLARKCRGAYFGLCALLFIAVNPWHLMISRWALESNILPFFLLLGLYFLLCAREKPVFYIAAAAAFGLSLYAYGTAFFFLPVFALFYILRFPKLLREKYFWLAGTVFLLFALPIGLCQLINLLQLDGFTVLGVTLPRLTESRQNATSVFGGGPGAILKNFTALLKLLVFQTDGLSFNSPGFGGMYYFFGLPLMALGLTGSLKTDARQDGEDVLRLAIYAGLLCALLISGNINRLNMLWLPLLYFEALGGFFLLRAAGKWAPVPVLGLFLCFGIFLSAYTARLASPGNANFFPGLGEGITAAVSQTDGEIYITDYVNQPYIFALFYTEFPPDSFAESVDYVNKNDAFRQVRSFGRFRFGAREDAPDAELYILHFTETEGYTILDLYGDYALCRKGG